MIQTCELARYFHFGGHQYDQLPHMLPWSVYSVFTHADIAPRNIVIDEITGIIDWEYTRIFW